MYVHTAEESEEEDEEPILKFEHEPLEAGETVLVPDGTDGVIEGIRRGNVVVRTDTALETFKLEEVKRKNIAPPGYVPPQRKYLVLRSRQHGDHSDRHL